ncbi:FAS1 domain-containing protein [Ilyonectria sp. MPI-CAGE-AT-0026]|nr:FAS1 domain-containing protein [Ilyonectria sp. MPI-CAGE-AT-0026]
MQFLLAIAVLGLASTTTCEVLDRQPLSYAAIPDGTYVAPVSPTTTTLLDFIESRDDLSILSSMAKEAQGFVQALNTSTNWQFTFFAPSNKAFENTGQYFETFTKTAKGKWWLGNLIQHHYVPNSVLKKSAFSTNSTRIQTGTFLYIGTQVVDGVLVLNNASSVTEADLTTTNGVVHIIDHILDPSAQIFQPDVTKTSQKFIPGSCANPALPYC